MEDNKAASYGRFIYREGRNNGGEALKVIVFKGFLSAKKRPLFCTDPKKLDN